jgi:hypothetical protein
LERLSYARYARWHYETRSTALTIRNSREQWQINTLQKQGQSSRKGASVMQKKTIEVKQIDWFDDHFYKIRYENEAKIEIEDYFASVTTKLGALAKPHLIRWYGDIGTREAQMKMREAGDRGSRIHNAWYHYTTGGAVVYQPERTPLYTRDELDEIYKRFNNAVYVIQNQDEMFNVMKLQQFHSIIKPREMKSETIVYNADHKEAGTADNIFEIDEGEYLISGAKPVKLPGGQYIFDLKTGSTVGKEAFMQVSAYLVCAESMGAPKFAGALIGHTSATTRSGIEGFKIYFLSREEALSQYSDYRDIARVWERNFGTKKPVIRQIPGLITLGSLTQGEQDNGSNQTDSKENIQKADESKGQVEQSSTGQAQRPDEGKMESKKERKDTGKVADKSVADNRSTNSKSTPGSNRGPGK